MKDVNRLSLRTLLKDYIEAKRSKLEDGTVKLTLLAFGYFVEMIGNVPIHSVRYKEVEQFQTWIVDAGRSRTTANIYIKSVSPVFTWAVRQGFIEENPFKRLSKYRITRKRINVYDNDELQALLSSCPSELWQARIMLGYTAGLRRGEVLNLTVDSVDFQKGEIHVEPKKETEYTWAWTPKDKDLRGLPLLPECNRLLVKILNQLPERQPYLMLTPQRYRHLIARRKDGKMSARQRKIPDEYFNQQFRNIRKRAGTKKTYHDLRRTFITLLLENGLKPHEAKELAGHSNIETTINFYTATRQSLAQKARRILVGATGLEPATS